MLNSLILIQKKGEVIGQQQLREMDETRVEILLGDWKKHGIDKACSKVEEWWAEELVLSMNQQCGIIQSIKCIGFPRLVHLDLRGNKIESIEMLVRIQMEKLEFLCLSHNQITNIRALNKNYWPSLETLSLTHNRWIKQRSNFFNEHEILNQCLPVKKKLSLWEINTLRSLACLAKSRLEQLADINLRWVFIGQKKYQLVQEKTVKKCLNRKWRTNYFKF